MGNRLKSCNLSINVMLGLFSLHDTTFDERICNLKRTKMIYNTALTIRRSAAVGGCYNFLPNLQIKPEHRPNTYILHQRICTTNA